MSDSLFYPDWLKKAEEDELVIVRILEMGPFSPICFHSQQMAEKLLKALLIYSHSEPPKMHDLVELGALIEPAYADIKDLKHELKRLSQFYIQTRYPADYPEFTKKEAAESFDMATRIKEFVMSKIKAGQP